MPNSRRGRFEPQGTRGSRFGSRKGISQRRNQKLDELSGPIKYQEGRRDLERMQEVRDRLVDYIQDEIQKIWRNLRGGKSEVEDSDYRLPQSLGPYGRVVRIWDTIRKKWINGKDIITSLYPPTFVIPTAVFSGTATEAAAAIIGIQEELVLDVPAGTASYLSAINAQFQTTHKGQEAMWIYSGIDSDVTWTGTVGGPFPELRGIFSDISYNNQTSSIVTATGVRSGVYHGGAISGAAYGFYAECTVNTVSGPHYAFFDAGGHQALFAGTLSNYYGLYLTDPSVPITGSTYGVYQKGFSNLNVFEGAVNIRSQATVSSSGGEVQLTIGRSGAGQMRFENTNVSRKARLRWENNSEMDSGYEWQDGSGDWYTVWKHNPDNGDFIIGIPSAEVGDASLFAYSTNSWGSMVHYMSAAGTTEKDLNFKYKDGGGTVHETRIHEPCFAAYVKSGNQVTTTGWVTLSSWTEKLDAGGFTPSSGQITVPQAGYYRLSAHVWGESTTANRSQLGIRIQENQSGSGYTDIAYMYNYAKRDATQTKGGCSVETIHQLAEGDIVRIQVIHVGDALTIPTLGAFFNIERIY